MRLDLRCWAFSLLLAVQLVFMFYYVLVTAPLTRQSSSTSAWSAISFVQAHKQTTAKHRITQPGYIIPPVSLSHLSALDRKTYFGLFNNSRCFLPGTDVRFSKRYHYCECLSGWHGPDCGLPEVIWRAFITARHTEPPQRREHPRRIVSVITSLTSSELTEIFIQELNPVVDLFIMVQTNTTLELPVSMKQKVLQITLNSESEIPWLDTRQLIPDLKHDDLVIFMTENQIPNSKALIFFKLYDGWPQPIAFRLRWSVFGFFWQHPKRTILGGTACTAGMIAKQYRDNVNKLVNRDQSLLVIGDLNHFGGWECSWCLQSPLEIINKLQVEKPKDWDVSGKTIDTTYIVELISNGIWVDGKTQLLRAGPSMDPYFAPSCVLNDSQKYDFLVHNMHFRFEDD